MLDFTTLAASVTVTFATQSAYYCLIKFPSSIEQKTRLFKATTDSISANSKDAMRFMEAASSALESINNAVSLMETVDWNESLELRSKYVIIFLHKLYECRGLRNFKPDNIRASFEADFLDFLRALISSLERTEPDRQEIDRLQIEVKNFHIAIDTDNRRNEIATLVMLAEIENVNSEVRGLLRLYRIGIFYLQICFLGVLIGLPIVLHTRTRWYWIVVFDLGILFCFMFAVGRPIAQDRKRVSEIASQTAE